MTTQVFNANGTFTVPTGVTSIDVLVVGGGGRGGCVGGGTHGAGGGGAGRVRLVTGLAVTPGQTCPVVIGAGGVDDVALNANAGGTSQITVPTGGTAYSAAGGGYGGFQGAGGNGASGGGGGSFSGANQIGGTASAGNAGGTGFSSATTAARAGGGGGGAGAAGGNAATNVGGVGGAGVDMHSVVGTGVGQAGWFGGGGGGGGQPTPGAGGQGGGGAATATAGTANTGGGGGGARGAAPQRGAAGGSGVVIVIYTALVAPNPPTSLAVDPDETTADVTWVAPVAGTVVIGYEYRLDGGAAVDVGLTLGTTLIGLTASTSYDVEVRSYNAAGASSWVGPETFVTDDPPPPPPPGYYRAVLELGDHAWEVTRGDDAAYGPELPLTLGWEIGDSVVYFPAMADMSTMTFRVLTNDAADLADVNKGTPVVFRMYVTEDPDEEPWQTFDGVVTQLDGETVPSATDPDGRDFLMTVYAADDNARLADMPVGYTVDWPIERITERAARICAEVPGLDYAESEAFDGLEGWLPARPARSATSALEALRDTFKDAALRDGDGTPPTYYGRPVFEYIPADPSIPTDPSVMVFPFWRRVYPDTTVTLNGDWCLSGASASWTKQPGPHMPEWVIVDDGVFGTPGAGVPVVVGTSLVDPPDAPDGDSSQTRGYLGESLLADGSTALDGWSTRVIRYVAGYVNPKDPDDGADPEPVRYWASFAPPRGGGVIPPIVPVIVTPLVGELELNGVDYLAGTLTGARLVIPPGGEYYLEVKLRAELLPGTDLP